MLENGNKMWNVYTWKNIIVQWRPGWRVQKYSVKCVGMRCQEECTALPAPWVCQWKESGRDRAALIILFFIHVNRVCSVLLYLIVNFMLDVKGLWNVMFISGFVRVGDWFLPGG